MTTQIPIFPLRSVLCPGVALPLHIFEERYRLMIARCLDRGEPFGVVLLREGREVGPLTGRIAEVGTTAAIRRAGRYPDGQLDILTVGEQRFRIDAVDDASEPYLLGHVHLLDEPTGPAGEADEQAVRVGRRFLRYLELLQPDGVPGDGPEIEIEFEIEVDDDTVEAVQPESEPHPDAEPLLLSRGADEPSGADTLEPIVLDEAALPADVDPFQGADPLVQEIDAADLSSEQRRDLLMAAARRLTATDDPTALSYVLTALIQVDLASRQDLLEAPDTAARLMRLDALLARESWFLRQGLRPIIIDPGALTERGR